MKYRLIVLTHGVEDTLAASLSMFAEHVSPEPCEVLAHCDGHDATSRTLDLSQRFSRWRWSLSEAEPQRGFCDATRRAWQAAAAPGVDWVFWLEHDFLVTRPVDLADLADVLERNPDVAQMQLLRNAGSDEEVAAGGLLASRPGAYERRETLGHPWNSHAAYWSTNPSLFAREIAAAHPWPADGHCEGRFGIGLVEQGYRFGVWGDGLEYVRHIGHRTGFGY